jgi:hypothetical protein
MSDFAEVAPYLNGLQVDPEATVHFDMFACALVWSDELGAADNFDLVFANIGMIRAVLHYRSTLIEGTTGEKHRSQWEKALQMCPDWPGFVPQRRDPALAPTLIRLRDTTTKKWEDGLTRVEKQLSEKQRKAIA